MQSVLHPTLSNDRAALEAQALLKACVHCGFCLAACPTYLLTGDEQESPRGRIYLIKSVLEQGGASRASLDPLDHCLTCRACEAHCPSGVEYGHLVSAGRELVERQVQRPLRERWLRQALLNVLLRPWLFGGLLGLGRWVRGGLPNAWRRRIPVAHRSGPVPGLRHQRQVILFQGCVQPALAADINAAAARLLDRLGISVLLASNEGCCGALPHHLNESVRADAAMRRNINAWWPLIESGAEAIVVTASGCGSEIKDYAHYFRKDSEYGPRARRVAALARDLIEVVLPELGGHRDERSLALNSLGYRPPPDPQAQLAFHAPCSLQHGQRIQGQVEALLEAAGVTLTPVPDAHLCCGSAGTYSILQPALSERLRAAKITHLMQGDPAQIVTANIGCQTHLAGVAERPVLHWVSWLDQRFMG